MYEIKNINRIALLVLSCAWLFLFSCAGKSTCVPSCIRYTKGVLVEVDRPVRLEIKREGFDVVYREANLVNGIVFYEGRPLSDSFEFSDATVRIMEKD